MDTQTLIQLAPILGAIGLAIALVILVIVKRMPVASEEMAELGEKIHAGAMVFLRSEYSLLMIFVVVVSGLLFAFVNPMTAVAFVSGALASMAAGFAGMTAATSANVRTTSAAAEKGENAALMVAFLGGSVMGLSVASLGLLGVGTWFLLYGTPETAVYINGFAMGASSIALFARVGGGIFTKAADVGADLVGKVEAGIPEDDPRNPGVIADNVGDNVGDVAGMGADIFESYVGSMIATIAIAATLAADPLADLMAEGGGLSGSGATMALMSLPLIMAMIGLLASLLGIASMAVFKNTNPAGALRWSALFLGRSLPGWRLCVHRRQRSERADLVCGRRRDFRRPGDRLDHRVLHRRQTDPRHRRGQRNRRGDQHHPGACTRPAVVCRSGLDDLLRHLGCQRDRRSVRHRDRGGRHAGDGRDHDERRRLRPDRRQRRRYLGDVRAWPGGAQDYRWTRLRRQHHRRDRQGLRHRLGGAHRPGLVLGLHAGGQPAADRRGWRRADDHPHGSAGNDRPADRRHHSDPGRGHDDDRRGSRRLGVGRGNPPPVP